MTSQNQSLQTQLQAQLAKANGALSFADFMETILYAPELGYYARPTMAFGEAGDFVTAPTLSPLFADCLASQYQSLQADLSLSGILECGAGNGALIINMIQALDALHVEWQHYTVVERSAALIDTQQAACRAALTGAQFAKIQWARSLEDLSDLSVMVIGNEVLDAMPVHLFEVADVGVLERIVVYENSGWTWSTRKAIGELAAQLDTLQAQYQLPVGYQSEYCALLQPWLQQLSDALKQGVIFLIDYGFRGREYYHPDRKTGTLMCHHQHRAHPDPLIHLGEQDVTAHVDFTAVAEAASMVGLTVAGYVEQASFLLSLGLTDHFTVRVADVDEQTRLAMAQHVKILTMPHEMGELFKVIALGKAVGDVALQGFAMMDKRHRL